MLSRTGQVQGGTIGLEERPSEHARGWRGLVRSEGGYHELAGWRGTRRTQRTRHITRAMTAPAGADRLPEELGELRLRGESAVCRGRT